MIKNNDAKLYVWKTVIVMLISLFTMLSNQSVVSLLFRVTFIMLLLGVINQLYRHHFLNELHILAISIIVISFINLLIRTPSFTPGYFNKFIIFSSTVIIIPYILSIPPDKLIIKYIMNINMILAALYPIMYLILSVDGYSHRWLTLNFTNPNLTAMYLLHSALYCFVGLYYYKKTLAKVLISILTCILIYLIFITESRSCYVAILVFLIFFIKTLISSSTSKISNGFSLLIILSPILIMILYLYLSKIQFLDNLFNFIDLGEGKAVSSREIIWEFGLKYFYDHPLLGSYYHISKGSGISQLHNTHLDILVSYGLVPALLFIALLYRALERILANSPTKLSNISIFAFFAIIIQGSFEAALVSGGVGLYILSFGFLLIACCSNNSLESSEEST